MSNNKGMKDKIEGEIKDRIGGVTGNKQQQAEGVLQKTTGKIKEAAEEAKDRTEEIVDDVKKKFKR